MRRRKNNVSDDALGKLPAAGTDTAAALDLYRAIGRLPPRLKSMILLRYFEDMKLEEITRVTTVI
ncbi:RNA polymerase sigma factor [Caproiciproducens galactitolivorans]|uniref:RNA polymerase sigma factor 70 region 4 type 2 domain-containing protein n=1 Tax=Caproiciproducens galactitolivorans TaxID=642589 RepID=A0ABT4BQF9_9FIRM|nr:sigma factor-like helix-turn-helix DNA-binding protein [Caproiciproducens galactitolivorans]MCY1713118.1 hypothetical protein [Caproiciproducens galactitolivorans]